MTTKTAVFWDVVQSGRNVLTLERSQLPPSTGEPNGSIHLFLSSLTACACTVQQHAKAKSKYGADFILTEATLLACAVIFCPNVCTDKLVQVYLRTLDGACE